MSPDELVLLAIIIALFGLIFLTKLKIELIAILVLLALGLSGLVAPDDVFSGFSSSVVITLIGLFVITHALEETGVVQAIAGRLNAIGQGSEMKLVTLFMFTGAALSLIMNNVAAGAVLLPAAVQVALISDVRVSKLLMPMSFGTLVGGMATYLTTANIVMSELLQNRGIEGLGMLDFIPVGSMIVLAGLAYMLLIGRHLLPERESMAQQMKQEADLRETYRLEERFWKIRVGEGSSLAHRKLSETPLREGLGLVVLSIQHGRQTKTTPTSEDIIRPADTLRLLGNKERIDMLVAQGNELLQDDEVKLRQNGVELPYEPVEIVIAPRSDAIGQSLRGMRFREKFGLLAVALWREGRSYRTDINKIPLRVGDALLMVGDPEYVQALAENRNYIVPSTSRRMHLLRPRKAPYAILITAVVLLIAILDLLPLPQMMLAGAAAMVVTGTLTMDEFFDAVEWRVIFLVAGMLPLSIALAETGLADRVGTLLVSALSQADPLVLVGGMALLTMLVVQIIGGQIAALLVGPIAINAALQIGVDPRAMSVAVAMACSMAFLTPIAHPVNILMMGPGGYNFSDFFKVGIGLTVVTLVTMLLGLSLLWGI